MEIEVVYDAFVLAAIAALVFFEESFAAVHWRPLFSSSHPNQFHTLVNTVAIKFRE